MARPVREHSRRPGPELGSPPTQMPSPVKRRREPLSRRRAKPENPFLSLLSEVQREVNGRLARLLEERRKAAAQVNPELEWMIAGVADLCARGGKRLRAALIVAGCRASAARYDADAAHQAGVAVELLQAYFLIHDDWMDRDPVRRGGPSLHALFGERLGEPHRGAVAAVLAGDYAAALALETLAGISLPKASLEAALARFARMQYDAVLGQQLDSFATDGDPETVYALKTGSYTVAGPLALGAAIAGAKGETLRALERFALPIGIAFQLRDDLLGAFGEPSKTGKPLGSDLRAGKRTRLLLEARRLLKPRERSALERVIGNDKARELDVRRALSSIESSGARARVEAQILELAATARAALSRGVSADGVALLSGAIDALTERVS